MANQYEVLGRAPTPDDLKKLSVMEKWKFYITLIYS